MVEWRTEGIQDTPVTVGVRGFIFQNHEKLGKKRMETEQFSCLEMTVVGGKKSKDDCESRVKERDSRLIPSCPNGGK